MCGGFHHPRAQLIHFITLYLVSFPNIFIGILTNNSCPSFPDDCWREILHASTKRQFNPSVNVFSPYPEPVMFIVPFSEAVCRLFPFIPSDSVVGDIYVQFIVPVFSSYINGSAFVVLLKLAWIIAFSTIGCSVILGSKHSFSGCLGFWRSI